MTQLVEFKAGTAGFASVDATLIVGILPGPHRLFDGGASRNLAQRWLFQVSTEGLGNLSMQTISFILALARKPVIQPANLSSPNGRNPNQIRRLVGSFLWYTNTRSIIRRSTTTVLWCLILPTAW